MSIIANQIKPLSNLADQTDGSAGKACYDGKGNTSKGKNHPSFTIILRKQLPVCFEIGQTMAGNVVTGDDPIEHELDSTQPESQVPSGCETNLQADFALANAWQVWILDESELMGNDWNVKKHGPVAQSGRQFWSNYSQVYVLFEDIKFKNLMIFQDQIEPKWEDAANIGGGRWYFDAPYNSRSEANRRECLLRPNYWTGCLETVLSGCLGVPGSLVVGLILNFKACKYRVSLWIRSCSDFNQVIQLGASLRSALNLRCQLKFELHSPATSTNSNSVLELN